MTFIISLLVNIINCHYELIFILDQENIIYNFYELCILMMSDKQKPPHTSIEQYSSQYTHEKKCDM